MKRFGIGLLVAGLAVAAVLPGKAGVPEVVRCATFNASLNRGSFGQLFTDLVSPGAGTAGVQQARRIAEIVQRNAPDILLVNEFDWDPQVDGRGRTVGDLFHDNFLAVPQNGQAPVFYPYRYAALPNTGFSPYDPDEDGIAEVSVPSAGSPGFLDFDNSGVAVTAPGTQSYGNDCYGFGEFRGRYGMVVYSRYPIVTGGVRTFRKLLWRDMPGARLPDDAAKPGAGDWYSAAELGVFRLSSKSHWDVPVDMGMGLVVHLLVSHPTPPVFDGAEDRNGKRNADEIRFWADYIDPARSGWVVDDAGKRGGLQAGARFVVMGDCNADPLKGDSVAGAAQQLTGHGLVQSQLVPAALRYGNSTTNTADFAQDLRVDYVLPSRAGWRVLDGAVYWPVGSHPQAALVTNANASDHRLVWLDVRPEVSLEEAVVGLDAAWTGGTVRLSWQGASGYRYTVESSAALEPAGWQTVPASVSGSVETGFFLEMRPDSPGRRFYRVRVSLAEGG